MPVCFPSIWLPSTFTSGAMTQGPAHLVRVARYLGCASVSLYVGVLMSRSLVPLLGGHTGFAFSTLIFSALAVLFVGSILEERALWRGSLSRSEDMPDRVGKPDSVLLGGAAPPPLSLGLALGLLSRLLA